MPMWLWGVAGGSLLAVGLAGQAVFGPDIARWRKRRKLRGYVR